MADISKLNGYDIKDKVSRDIIDNEIFNSPIGISSAKIESCYKEYISSTVISGNANYKILQGGTYITKDNNFVIALTNSDYTKAILVTLDSNFSVVSRSAELDLGHCGDMTYNESEQAIYCAVGASGINANKIVKVNKNTMTISSVLNSPTNRAIKVIAYDNEKEIYYLEDDVSIIKCDKDFNILERDYIEIEYVGNGEIVHQSGFIYNNIFYIIYTNRINGGYNTVYFLEFKDGKVYNSLSFPSPSTTLEAESVIVNGNSAYVFFGQAWLTVFKLSLTPRVLNELKPYDFGGVIQLTEGDLNDIGVGYYFIPNATAAANILNTPIDTMGMLLKSYYAGNYIYQEVLTNEMVKYIRRCSGGTWAGWHNMSGRTQNITPTYAENVGHTDTQIYVQGETLTINGRFTLTGGFTQNSWNTLLTLPFSPSNQVQGCALSMTPTPTPIGVRVTSEGLLQIYPPISGTTDARISMSINIA